MLNGCCDSPRYVCAIRNTKMRKNLFLSFSEILNKWRILNNKPFLPCSVNVLSTWTTLNSTQLMLLPKNK